MEDITIGGRGFERDRLALVGIILSVKVGIAIDEVKLAAISRITYRVDLYRRQEIRRDTDVGCRHRELVIITEVAGSRRAQCRYLVGGKIGHGHRANTPSISRADKEAHIVILLGCVIAVAVIQHTVAQRDVTAVVIGQAIGSDIIYLGRLVEINALIVGILIVR